MSRPGQQSPKPVQAVHVLGLWASEGPQGRHPGDRMLFVTCCVVAEGEVAFMSILSCQSLNECLSLRFRRFCHLPSDQEFFRASSLSPNSPEHPESVWSCRVIQVHDLTADKSGSQTRVTKLPVCLQRRGFPRHKTFSANTGTILGKLGGTGHPTSVGACTVGVLGHILFWLELLAYGAHARSPQSAWAQAQGISSRLYEQHHQVRASLQPSQKVQGPYPFQKKKNASP